MTYTPLQHATISDPWYGTVSGPNWCVREIPLTQGKVALVSNEDYRRVNKHSWHYNATTGYASAWFGYGRNGRWKQDMHRFILPTTWPLETDHINHNSLDNTRNNLRAVTKSQNAHNHKKQTGINWCKRTKRWRVRIKIDYKDYNIGYFHSREKAEEAYNKTRAELGVTECTSPSVQDL